jgi:hypothetical protein
MAEHPPFSARLKHEEKRGFQACAAGRDRSCYEVASVRKAVLE